MSNQKPESSQHLTFKLGDETYALSIVNVREVLKLPDLTYIPGMPDFIRGVVNVRGSVVPVVDLNRKFGRPPTAESQKKTRVIIVESVQQGRKTVMGALADSVDEVIELNADQIEPPPDVGMSLNSHYIKGIGKRDERFIILLDVGQVFSNAELSLLRTTKGQRSVAEATL